MPGAIWKIDTKGVFSLLHKFAGMKDGFGPNGPLMINTDGNLYGTEAQSRRRHDRQARLRYRCSR